MGRGKKTPQEKVQYILDNMYGRTIAELSEMSGLSKNTISRIKSENGVVHSEEEIKIKRENAARKCSLRYKAGIHKPVRCNPHKGQFQKGVSISDRLGKERFEEIHKKSVKTRIEKIRKDKLRQEYGLPQLTKLKIGRMPREKRLYRIMMSKYGYILIRGENDIIYYDENTNRKPCIEERGETTMGFKFIPYEEED